MKKIKAILFDLDDTLYPAIQFATGGFLEAGAFLEKRGLVSGREFYRECLRLFVIEPHSGRIFNEALGRFGIDKQMQERLLPTLVSVYREHLPKLRLFPDALKLLNALDDNYLVGIITDGDVSVQSSKVRALNLEDQVSYIKYTWDKGPEFGKPHLSSFHEASQKLCVPPGGMVYVGDNPYKDFIGAKKAGLHTIRIRRGPYRGVTLDYKREAHQEIANFEELREIIGN